MIIPHKGVRGGPPWDGLRLLVDSLEEPLFVSRSEVFREGFL